MFEIYLLLLVIVHISLWVIGVLLSVPGFILVAIVLDFITMAEAAIIIEYPVTLQQNSTSTFTIQATSDPSLAIALFVLLVWYLISYYEVTMRMREEIEDAREEGEKKDVLIWVPLELLKR